MVTNVNKNYKVTRSGDICYNPANLKFGVICKNRYGDAIFSPIYVTLETRSGYDSEFAAQFVSRQDFIWKEEDLDYLETAKAKYVEDRVATVQDENIISLLSIDRLKELTKYFVIYDANVKKICRYQQYFAIKEIIKTINTNDVEGNRQSGVIWHTQGSGKSLTMVMLAKYILLEMARFEPKVVIVTDRKELDKQIAKTFTHTRCKPARATSGKNLIDLINEGKVDIITTIINKFNTVESSGLKNLSRDVFVLVDESHRSNYGEYAD